MITRIPADFSAAELVFEFDGPAEILRHDLQALYLRPGACERLFEDGDADGVANVYDACEQTRSGAAVDATGRPLGDLNGDCEVDLRDFAVLQIGMTIAGR